MTAPVPPAGVIEHGAIGTRVHSVNPDNTALRTALTELGFKAAKTYYFLPGDTGHARRTNRVHELRTFGATHGQQLLLRPYPTAPTTPPGTQPVTTAVNTTQRPAAPTR